MKTFIVFVLTIAGISALPPQLTEGILKSDQRLITDTITSKIEELTQTIQDAGLDPMDIPLEQASYELPVPVLLSVNGLVEEFLFEGLSDIRITSLSFGTLTLRLLLDLQLPLIEATLGNAAIDAVVLGETINLSASGSLAVTNITVETDISFSVSISNGISVSSVDVELNVGAIESNLDVTGFGYNISTYLNHFFAEVVTRTVYQFKDDINELIEIILLDLINENL